MTISSTDDSSTDKRSIFGDMNGGIATVFRNGWWSRYEWICISGFHMISIYVDSKIMNDSDGYLNDGNMIDR